MTTTGWVVLGVIVVIVIWAISVYNGLVAMRQRTNQAFADIDVQLKQRHDLIPNLVETVKGYAAHESAADPQDVYVHGALIPYPAAAHSGTSAAICKRSKMCRRIAITIKDRVSSMSAICRFRSASKRVTCAARVRRRGSGYSRM